MNKTHRKKKIGQLMSILLVVAFFSLQATAISESATATDQVQLTLTVNTSIALDCAPEPTELNSLNPGTPVYATTTCTTTTNASAGYDLQVKRDDADTTLDLATDAATNIADRTAWDPTAGAGNGNAATWSTPADQHLGFGVYASTATKNTTWWGTGSACDDNDNKYAGFPAAYATIMDHDSYSSGSTTVSICNKVDTAGTQVAGDYNGTVTYQAVTKP